jgi:type I restriction enzyme S subunit
MSGALEAKESLRKHSTMPLRELTLKIFHAGRESRMWVDSTEYGVPFMGSTDILAADLSNLPFISKKQVASTPSFIIKKGWTLVTRSGTVGRMAYTRQEMDGIACSEDVMRVVPDERSILPGYLYAFLSSRFGVPLVVSGTYGAIIQHIEPNHIADLPVPRLGKVEEQAHELVQQAAELLTKYQSNLRNATALFFDSVGLKDITASEWHSWGTDFGFASPVDVHSFRALNFNPRFNNLCERIRQGQWKPLTKICIEDTLKSGPRFKRIDAEADYSYQLIGQKQIFWLRPEGRWIAKNSIGDEVLVPSGTILVAAQGTLGENELFCRPEFVIGNALEKAYSQHFLRVIADESKMKRGTLFAFIRSETAFRMFRSISMGSKLQDFHYSILPLLPIPCPPHDICERCNDLVIDAYEMRDKAVGLEDDARALIERVIEEGAC